MSERKQTYEAETTFLEKVKKASVPFKPEEHEWKPLSITEKGAWIAYYVDMRKMMERLQEVFGEAVSITVKPIDGFGGYNVLAELTVKTEAGVTVYHDFGYASPDTAEGLKSASTDAYRRVLSHLGIGRYLYHLPRIFIGGKRNGYRFIPKRDPIDVLSEVLENENLRQQRFLFIDAEEEDAYRPSTNGEAQNKRRRSESNEEDKTNSKTKAWVSLLGVDNQDDAVEALRDIAKRRGINYTEKQMRALIRMADPEETTLEDIEADPTLLKSMLDRAFTAIRR